MQTAELPATPQGLIAASTVLAQGGLVAFPTETVYGLGADARNSRAVAAIFAAKGRPSFNPLIVHVASVEAAKSLVVWSPTADLLAQAFWPGPLTLVLPLNAASGLSPLVTANLPSLAIRIPANPLARELLLGFGGPVAAPSANLSGKISPTSVHHVLRGLQDQIEAVIDGGDCAVGLESTIVGLEHSPTLLRPRPRRACSPDTSNSLDASWGPSQSRGAKWRSTAILFVIVRGGRDGCPNGCVSVTPMQLRRGSVFSPT